MLRFTADDAVAMAAELPVNDVRRAAMVAGGIAAVAAAVLTEGQAALHRFVTVSYTHLTLPTTPYV